MGLALLLGFALLVLFLWLTLRIAYSLSCLGKERSKVAKEVKSIQKDLVANQKQFSKIQNDLDKAVRTYIEAQHRALFASMPIEKIKDSGAYNVRISLLKRLGYLKVKDLQAVTYKQLRAIRGVGDHTARGVINAVREIAKNVQTSYVSVPDANLKEPFARQVGEQALRLVTAREKLLDWTYGFTIELNEFREQWLDYKERTSFSQLLTFFSERRINIYKYSSKQHQTLIATAQKLKANQSFLQAGEARAQFNQVSNKSLEQLSLEFTSRYADCSACYEEALIRISGSAKGSSFSRGLTKEIADEIEAFQIKTAGLKVSLRQYQRFGAKYILCRQRSILGDEMGLGKTIEALAAVVHTWNSKNSGHYLIVAPAGLTANWIKEIQNRTSIPQQLLIGQEKDKLTREWLTKGGIAVTSYNTLINLGLVNLLKNNSREIDILISDEAHYVKNPNAQRTRAIRDLAKVTKTICLMSGTPMENRPEELCNLIEIVRPGQGKFLCSEIFTAKSIAKFHEKVAGIYLRRNQEDVLRELPEKIEVSEWVELEKKDIYAYRSAASQKNFMAMRRAATIGNGDGSSAKLMRLNELLQDHKESGRKVIIFSYFLDVLKLLATNLEVVGLISGSMNTNRRLELVENFQNAPEHEILLSQIEAGGQGLNIQSASAVVIMEPQLKPTTEDQAIARAHRMGQTKKVIVHRMLARNCVDELLVNRLSHKRDLFDTYARESLVKRASNEATETGLINEIMEAECKRLNLLSA